MTTTPMLDLGVRPRSYAPAMSAAQACEAVVRAPGSHPTPMFAGAISSTSGNAWLGGEGTLGRRDDRIVSGTKRLHPGRLRGVT